MGHNLLALEETLLALVATPVVGYALLSSCIDATFDIRNSPDIAPRLDEPAKRMLYPVRASS